MTETLFKKSKEAADLKLFGQNSSIPECDEKYLHIGPASRPQPPPQRHPVREGLPLRQLPEGPRHGRRRFGGAAGRRRRPLVRGRAHQVEDSVLYAIISFVQPVWVRFSCNRSFTAVKKLHIRPEHL